MNLDTKLFGEVMRSLSDRTNYEDEMFPPSQFIGCPEYVGLIGALIFRMDESSTGSLLSVSFEIGFKAGIEYAELTKRGEK